MKRFLIVLMSFMLCISLFGCANKKSAMDGIQINETLLNKDFEFYSTEYKMTMTVSSYLDYLQNSFQSDSGYYIHEFTLFDLDFDGNNELVCRLGVGVDKYFGTVVFHTIEDKIYGYDFTRREFGVLKADGTVPYSLNGFDNGFRSLTFNKEGWDKKLSTYSESVLGDHEGIRMDYYVKDMKTTKEEFEKAYEEYNKLEDIKFEKIHLDKNTLK